MDVGGGEQTRALFGIFNAETNLHNVFVVCQQ
jgi:hypothetical protein